MDFQLRIHIGIGHKFEDKLAVHVVHSLYENEINNQRSTDDGNWKLYENVIQLNAFLFQNIVIDFN